MHIHKSTYINSAKIKLKKFYVKDAMNKKHFKLVKL